MRWNPPAQHHDTRVVRKFLWFPLELPVGELGSKTEVRWWEYAEIHQTYIRGYTMSWWSNDHFVK